MSKYTYSESEQDMLMVIKHNQQKREKLLSDLQKMKEELVRENNEIVKRIDEIVQELGISLPNDEISDAPVRAVPTIIVPNWDELVKEAKESIPYDVDFEDLLTSEEFENALHHLDEIEDEFAKKTKLKKVDMVFLATAIVLQCVRQYVLGPWLKDQREGAASNDEAAGRKGNTGPGWYYVETEKILTNKVPFDTTKYGSATTVQGFLKGGYHRMTLGHDPLLGWVFGTANILTSTLTRWDFASAHIKNQKTPTALINGENVIYSLADTAKVFEACSERLFRSGWDGKLAVGSAIIREAIHLQSDIKTKQSLPLPFVSVSPEFAKKLSQYGIDTASVASELGLAVLINTLVAMVHRLFYDESTDDAKLYEVRTRKILLYSNSIASVSNVIAAFITQNPKNLDIGGLIVTIIRLFSDVRFIARVKQEFIESQLDIHFNGIVDELERMYTFETK